MLPADATAPPEASDDRNAASVLDTLHAQTYRQTDRLFGVLLLLQYGAGIVLALTVAPGTGVGLLLLSTLAMLAPAVLAFMRPGQAYTRYAVAAGQMLASALLIHLTGGRIETHFHVFASLGLLSLYRDWKVLALAGGVSLADHVVRGLADPLSIFGAEDVSPWRVVEHAWWIVVMAGFLITGCRWAVRQMREVAAAHADTQATHDRNNQALIQARDQEEKLAAKQDELQGALRDLEEQRRTLHAGVELMMEHMNAFADGDLSVQLPNDQRDEFGRLYQGFNHALGNVRAMLKQVTHVVEQTVAAAAQISASAEELAAGSHHQSMQATEVAAAVEEMTATIVENARNASQTSTVATENGQMAREGREVVDQTVQKIRQIAAVVRSSSETIERLGASSNEIGAIVSVINEIADQTNLLALNAAIEAARAGEHGRGFAVVADEVRQLAERTTTATKQIADMIATIQSDTKDAVSAMQQGNQEVEEGIRLADSAGDALARIVSGVEESIDIVNQIAAASEEQSTTSEEIARNVETISNVSSESATGIGQIAQGSENLTSHMRQLQHLLEQFRLDAPAHASSSTSSHA